MNLNDYIAEVDGRYTKIERENDVIYDAIISDIILDNVDLKCEKYFQRSDFF